MILAKLKAYYFAQQMRPGLAGLFVNPFYFARKELFVAMKEFGPQITGRVLDVGCGERPYESLIRASEYVGLEIDTPESRARRKADAFYDGGRFPFEDGSFDAVICNEVLEHVFEPDAFVREIGRVLKKGGRLLLTVPFVWDEHEQPRDYGRYSSFGLAALLQRHGFKILRQRKTASDVKALFQLLNGYIYKITLTRSPYANLFITLLLMAPFNLIGTVLAWITPRNPDLFLDNVVLAERKSPLS
jgi:SAM-dependent methyltransferase